MQHRGEAGQPADPSKDGTEEGAQPPGDSGLQGGGGRRGGARRSEAGDAGLGGAATRGSGYSPPPVGRRRLAVVDVPVWQGVGHGGALRGAGGKVLQQISRPKRHGCERPAQYQRAGRSDEGTGSPPGLHWAGGQHAGVSPVLSRQRSCCLVPRGHPSCTPAPPPATASLSLGGGGGVLAPGRYLRGQNSSGPPGGCALAPLSNQDSLFSTPHAAVLG